MERTDIGDFNGLGTMEMNAMRYVEVLESSVLVQLRSQLLHREKIY